MCVAARGLNGHSRRSIWRNFFSPKYKSPLGSSWTAILYQDWIDIGQIGLKGPQRWRQSHISCSIVTPCFMKIACDQTKNNLEPNEIGPAEKCERATKQVRQITSHGNWGIWSIGCVKTNACVTLLERELKQTKKALTIFIPVQNFACRPDVLISSQFERESASDHL